MLDRLILNTAELNSGTPLSEAITAADFDDLEFNGYSLQDTAHISSIIKEVFGNGADGIDIDYEGKYARTRPYFSLFLKDLKEAIGYNKWITHGFVFIGLPCYQEGVSKA